MRPLAVVAAAHAGQLLEGLLEDLLNGPQSRLALPAVEVGAVVGEGQLDVPHRIEAIARTTQPAGSDRHRRQLEQLLGDLHGVGGRALAEVVADAPEQEGVGPAAGPGRMRPTKTSSLPAAAAASGYGRASGSSTTVTPGASAQRAVASSTVIGRSVSTRIDSLCEYGTGTRTQVGLTSIVESPMILRVSLTIFISSLV